MEENDQIIYYKINPNNKYTEIKLKEHLEKISIEKLEKILVENGFNEDYFGLIKRIQFGDEESGNFRDLNKEENLKNKIYIQIELNKNRYIYYKINDNAQFYIREVQNQSITKKEMEGHLYNEGFNEEDVSLIKSIKYNFDKNGQKNDLTEDKVDIEGHNKDPNIDPNQGSNNILYVYLEIKDEKKSQNEMETNDYNYYKSNLDELQKKVNELSQDISNKNTFTKTNINKKQEFSENQKLQKMYGINQNINFDKKKQKNEEIKNPDNKGISLFYLYSFPLKEDQSNNKGKRNTELNENYSDKNIEFLKKNEIINNEVYDNEIKYKKDNKEIYKNEKNELINEDYIYYNQIFSIYSEFKNAKIKANLKIEPINENIEEYLEQSPDILHIKINSFLNKSHNGNNNEDEESKLYFYLELYGNGDLTKYSGENLKIAFKYNLSKIKLLIFSTQNIEEMEKLFENIEFKNIIFINSSESNEKEENIFIKSLYNNLLKKKTIEESYNESKKEVGKNLLVKLKTNKNNNDVNKKFDLSKGEINFNKNCSLNLDFVKYNYKIVMGRNEELKICITQFKKNKKVCVLGYEGVGKKSFAQKVGYYLYERNIMNNIYYLELYSLYLSKEILKLKIEEIINNINNDNENTGFENKNILIIIYFNFIIRGDNDIKSLEKIIRELNESFYYLFVFTISKTIKRKDKNKQLINFSSIELKPFGEQEKKNKEKIFNNLLKIERNIENLNLINELLNETKGWIHCTTFENKIFQEKKICKDTIIKNKKKKNNNQQNKERQEEAEKQTKDNKNEVNNNGCSEACPYDCPGDKAKSPNDIYLMALYINLFSKNKNIKEEMKNMPHSQIIREILNYEQNDINIKTIFSIFCILKFGISDDILKLFFNDKEIKFIKENLNYLIFVEKNKNESIYYMDNSYIDLVMQILIDEFEDTLLTSLKSILKNYALIFKHIAYHSDFPYNIIMQLHPQNDFWEPNDDLNKEYEDFEKKHKQFFFDDVVYANNVYDLFNYKDLKYERIIKKQKEKEKEENKKSESQCEGESTKKGSLIYIYKEYIYQIAIYLSTILYFKKSFLYKDLILNFFIDSLQYFDFGDEKESPIKLIKLRMLKYFISDKSDKSHLSKIEEIIKTENKKAGKEKTLGNDILIIYYLIQIFDSKNKIEEVSNLFKECQALIKKEKNDKIDYNLTRLKILYFTQTISENNLEIKDLYNNNNKYFELRINILEIENHLNNNEFDEFDQKINKCEEKIKSYLNDFYLRNSDIHIKIASLKEKKNKLFNDYIKKKLFFFTASPFYNEDGKELLTEANNSFYLKYKLKTSFPNLQIEFQQIDRNFKTQLRKCLNYPIKFLYIGSDGYNNNGNIISENNFQSEKIDNKEIEKIINESKCKDSCDIVILGILNNDENDEKSLYKIFKSNNFRHIIYIKKDVLIDLFEKEPLFYFYFQNCFFNFVKDFIHNLIRSLTIREAFRRANYNFNENLKKIKIILTDGYEENNILCIEGKNDDDTCDFGFINNENFNSYMNQKNIIKKDKKDYNDEYDEEKMKKNNIYFRKNPFNNEFKKKNEEETKSTKNQKFLPFPGNYYLKEEQLERRFYGLKKILEHFINFIKENQIVNLYSSKFLVKTKLCIEICKYFYMNNYFKKGIFIIDLKYFKKNRCISELENRSSNKNIEKDKSDMLIILIHVEKIKDNLWKWINNLKAHIIISTYKKINYDDLSLEKEQSEKNQIIDSKKDNKKNTKDNEVEPSKSEIKKIMKYYNLDEEIDKQYPKKQDINQEEEKINLIKNLGNFMIK